MVERQKTQFIQDPTTKLWTTINPDGDHTPGYDEIMEFDRQAGLAFGGGNRHRGSLVFTPTPFWPHPKQTVIGRAFTPRQAEIIVRGDLRARVKSRQISRKEANLALRSNPHGKNLGM